MFLYFQKMILEILNHHPANSTIKFFVKKQLSPLKRFFLFLFLSTKFIYFDKRNSNNEFINISNNVFLKKLSNLIIAKLIID